MISSDLVHATKIYKNARLTPVLSYISLHSPSVSLLSRYVSCIAGTFRYLFVMSRYFCYLLISSGASRYFSLLTRFKF